MRTPINTELITFNNWTLRVRAADSPNPRLLILIHGWTGDENSMWVFTRNFSPTYAILAPRAPHHASPSGFSWREMERNTSERPSAEKFKPAAEALIQLVDEYSTSTGINSAQFDMMGFSQGAAMANIVGLYYPQRIRKLAILAGFVPPNLEDLILQKPLTGKNIFVAHGTQDQMVTVDRARASVELLKQAGAEVTYCEDEVGHKLSSNALRALENYLRD